MNRWGSGCRERNACWDPSSWFSTDKPSGPSLEPAETLWQLCGAIWKTSVGLLVPAESLSPGRSRGKGHGRLASPGLRVCVCFNPAMETDVVLAHLFSCRLSDLACSLCLSLYFVASSANSPWCFLYFYSSQQHGTLANFSGRTFLSAAKALTYFLCFVFFVAL